MKLFYRFTFVLIMVMLFVASFGSPVTHALSNTPPVAVTEWQMMWEEQPGRSLAEVSHASEDQWMSFVIGDKLPAKPDGVKSAWVRLQIPETGLARPALLVSKLTAKDVMIYDDNKLVYESVRKYPFNKNVILLPLNNSYASSVIYFLLKTESDWLGIKGEVSLGDYHTLSKQYLNSEVLDVILGTALLFIAVAMYVCSIFLNKTHLSGWSSLSTIIISVGFMVITYSTYLHSVYPQFEALFFYLFEFASLLIMPATFIFFEKIFGKGPYGLISMLRKIQFVILLISLSLMGLKFFFDEINDIYQMLSMIAFGSSVVFGNIALLFVLVKYCISGNREAVIISSGFGTFCLIGIIELFWYFYSGMNYQMFFWKWGILFFIASLIAILTRNILKNYDQLIVYSKKLEVFNNELQRSEKMEVISQLAASVAHEVRNPLQVTRGFLQIISEKTQSEKDKGFMVLAIDELDRASEIITDFLTFAKPQLDQTELLNLVNEINQIEAIMVPLATMQGASISVELVPDLYVRGNSSKFKQALINIIKNSIESLRDGGEIKIKAIKDSKNNIIISISDTGEGMDESELKRLGEPYYSKKSKGTGLGLMVTFRIIEVMEGKLEFSSVKGTGTEAVISFATNENTPTTV